MTSTAPPRKSSHLAASDPEKTDTFCAFQQPERSADGEMADEDAVFFTFLRSLVIFPVIPSPVQICEET